MFDVFLVVAGSRVRVGSAVQAADGFTLQLDAPGMVMSPKPAGGGAVFPPYGRSKGQPVAGASAQDLAFYAAGAERSLADPAKARWHDKERALLEAIQAEQRMQEGRKDPESEKATLTGQAIDPADIPF